MKTILISISLLVSVVEAWAVDAYNPANGQLNIPFVTVGDTTYTNVIVSVGKVISVGSAPGFGTNDYYDLINGQLTIPSVILGAETYYNVVATLEKVISVGSSYPKLKDAIKNIVWRQTDNSIPLTNDWNNNFSLEGYTTFDFEGNGVKSFFFPPGNFSWKPRFPTDYDFQIFQLTLDNKIVQTPSPLKNKYVPGHVNDDILKGNFGNNGQNSLIFIDHGREPQDLPHSQWEKSYLWRMDKVNNEWTVKEFAQNLGKQFWHSSSNPIDINGDGILDFSVAALSDVVNVLFLSNKATGTHESISLTKGFIKNCGSSALINLANGSIGSICLPYTPSPGYDDGSTGYIHTLSSDGRNIASTQSIKVRNTSTTSELTDIDGFNLIRVLDLNKDGLMDFVGMAEQRDGSNGRVKHLIVFLQTRDSQFIQANELLGIPFSYSIPKILQGQYVDWIDSTSVIADINGDGLLDFVMPTELIGYDEVITNGIRGGFIQTQKGFIDLTIPNNKIIWNSEKSPYNFRYILPIEINSDGIIDFVLVGTTFDQPKSIDNPYGQMFHLSILKSEVIH